MVVCEAPFLPAHGGGEREHLGFVQAAVAAGYVSALVVSADDDPGEVGRADDLDGIRALIAPAPLIVVARNRSPVRALLSPHAYVIGSRPAPPDLARRVRDAAPDTDGVLIFSYKASELGHALARDLGLPAVLRQHNLEGPYHRSLAAAARGLRRVAYTVEAFRVDRHERRLERADWLRGMADISASDAARRAQRAKVAVVHVPSFSLGPRASQQQAQWRPSTTATVVFLGALDIATNLDAVTWFAERVWPSVLHAAPSARWQVVGRKPSAAVRELVARTPATELHPDVDDPNLYLAAAGVAVNPAVSGSGVNIKLVEYLAMGVPTVSTTRGMNGLGLRAGQELLVADDPDPFAAAVTELLTQPDRAAAIGARGRQTSLAMMDTTTNLAKLAALFDAP